MTAPPNYATIARDTTVEIEIKRSRFRCTLRRVTAEADAREVVAAARSEYFDARHHCSAFILGPRGDLQRSSDDGEPSGTAGAPMLAALTGAGVSDVAAVVTRWFGGILLGTGGLARAYGDSVRAALEPAGLLTRTELTEVELCLPHADAGRIDAALRDAGVHVINSRYETEVTLTLATTDPESLAHRIAGLTSGTAAPKTVGTRWVDGKSS